VDLGPLRTLVRDVSFDTLGVDATVTRPYPDDAAIPTRIVWIRPAAEDAPFGGDIQRRTARRVLALRRDEVPTVPRGTVITAPDPEGGAARQWRVEGPDRVDTATVRVIVVEEPA
jgi:hypothetical protein